MTKTIEELVYKRRNWVEANRENGFETGLKRLLTDLYPDNAHFIYELLQNAEDAHAKEVRFILHEDCVELEHDGKRLFTIQDVDAITSIGFSTKRENSTNIGKFGVGFKAVFAYTDSPEIESGEYHFRIRDMVVPELNGLSSSQLKSKQTRFILPFDNSKKLPEQAKNEIERLLKALGATTLLFLAHIQKIEYLLPDLSLGYIEKIDLDDNHVEIRVQHPENSDLSYSRFLKFDKVVQIEDDEAENEEHKVKDCRLAVAFGLNQLEAKKDSKKKKSGKEKAIPEWELLQMEPGRVCIYFPADKETSNLRFHLHAPFASTVARDSVRDCAGNNVLRDHLADLLADSMSEIRDQGLLTVRALAVLPNDKDNLPEFYQPFMNRLIAEFQKTDLVPMKRGGHAATRGIFRGSKNLSDLIDDDDLVTLLDDDYCPPMWVSNPPQRNQREDNFLSMLEIEQWDTGDLVKALTCLNQETLSQWMGDNDEKWHQALYGMLNGFINKAPKNYFNNVVEERKHKIKVIALVRCSDGIYRKGNECFFPTDAVEHDSEFPRVAKGVYFADGEKSESVRKFLEIVGVREVDEKAEIEHMLKIRYSQEVVNREGFKPQLNDIKRFIEFADKHPVDSNLFQGFFIFELKDGKWATPDQVYLDMPYMDTGLGAYYRIPGIKGSKFPLSDKYGKLNIKPDKIGKFGKWVGAIDRFSVSKQEIPYDHPRKKLLSDHGGWSYSYGVNEDYDSEEISTLCRQKTIDVSKLIWKTISKCSPDFLYAHYRSNSHYSLKEEFSSLVFRLKDNSWVPQNDGNKIEFVKPRDAVVKKLPEGFTYEPGSKWLKAIEFGKGVEEREEAQRLEQERQTTEYQRKEKVAKDMGFQSPEEAVEIATLKKENPEEFKKFKEKVSARKNHPTFPTKPVANPERRKDRLAEQLTDAPDKKYEKRERSVRTTNGTINPTTWLRNQYTNEADQMVCQICKEEMPFRKRDGAHYFEKKEVLSKKYLPKEYEAQYLALCPLCAAKYDEFVKTDDEVMVELREEIVSSEDCEIPISLGDEKTSILFVETHFHDLKNVLGELG